MSEMEKLQKWLDKNNIKYERRIEDGVLIDIESGKRLNTNQILIKTNDIELSFICHYGSYGYEQGLIEMYDHENEPEGWLTAEKCISKIKEVLSLDKKITTLSEAIKYLKENKRRHYLDGDRSDECLLVMEEAVDILKILKSHLCITVPINADIAIFDIDLWNEGSQKEDFEKVKEWYENDL